MFGFILANTYKPPNLHISWAFSSDGYSQTTDLQILTIYLPEEGN